MIDFRGRYPLTFLAAPPAGQEEAGRPLKAKLLRFPEAEDPWMSSSFILTLRSPSFMIAGTWKSVTRWRGRPQQSIYVDPRSFSVSARLKYQSGGEPRDGSSFPSLAWKGGVGNTLLPVLLLPRGSWDFAEAQSGNPSPACLQPSSRPSRLRHRPAPGLPANPQRVRVRESLQVRRRHGHAAWQVVQGGALREESLRRHWGKPSAAAPHMLTQRE